MFTPFDPKKTMPEVEEEVLKFWQDNKIFEKSVSQREKQKPFVFYEGPPTANGKPGIHHVMTRTFKDLICRYQTMKGRYVLRKAGWDTHGLPVELQVEKSLGLNNKQDIENYGIAAFNAKSKESVWQYKEEWEKITKRMSFWLDMEHPYITYEPEYIESIWWALRQIWDKGLIYQDYKVVPFCTRCGTALSMAEVAQGYKDVTEVSVYVKFALKDEPNAAILAWTTTPWTLPGNVGLAVGEEIPYVAVKQGEETFYLAKDRLSVLEGEYEVVKELTGHELVGREYEPLFDWLDLGKESGKKAYYVLPADFVTTEDGTGVVHTAVMYGEEDFNLGKSAHLPAVHTVNERGEFNNLVKPWVGQYVKSVEPTIIEYLKEHNHLYKTEQTTHTYPFCWRCSTALLYYARSSWFIRIEPELRERLVALNQNIKWVPDHIRDGRFGNWLEGLRDWAISRERYWGTPLPIWRCEKDKSHQSMIGSYAELTERATETSKPLVTKSDFDPHKPLIDEIVLRCDQCEGEMHRVPEVIDVWIDSGAMPFAQWHYPFANEEQFKQQFPADYIAEGVDQTRGWFNSMHVLSALLFDQEAYKSVICMNLVLDENGQKMSKSKGNVVNPMDVITETGIDAIRYYFLSVNQPGDNKNFSVKAVTEVYRKVVMIWWNVTSFFLTYASVDKWQPDQKGESTTLDRWIVSLANQTASKMDASLQALDTFTAARAFGEFIDELSTWYLRRSRKRRDVAFYATLHQVLIQAAQMAAPLMPFLAEATYRAVKTEAMAESVHLTDFPSGGNIDTALLEQMAQIRQVVTLGHATRVTMKMKVRQPLAAVAMSGMNELSPELRDILADELNVKEVMLGEIPGNWPKTVEGSLQVALDPNLTDTLKEEGIVRELVRELQELRKKSGCRPGQLVTFNYETTSETLVSILEKYREQLIKETNGRTLQKKAGESPVVGERAVELDGQSLWLGLTDVA